VVDWFAYGHAARTVRGATETFGTGDVRGVIAPESANNAKEGGALVPTVAFGVPGSASMAILLGAFLIQGLVPGPAMLTEHLDVTYAMVWSVALANILGAGLCFLFSGQFAKIATLRYTLILPIVMCVLYVGAFQGSRDWGDLYALLAFGVLGWTMKQLRWPRPPLILGFVLGAIIERYMFISAARYGFEWLFRPVVAVLLLLALLGLLRPLIGELRAQRRAGLRAALLEPPSLRAADLLYVLVGGLVALMLVQASAWEDSAKSAPMIVGTITLAALTLSLLNQIFRRSSAQSGLGSSSIHMDLISDTSALGTKAVVTRGAFFFGWLVAFMAAMAAIGLIPTAALFIVAYMRLENREPWRLVLPQAIGVTLFIYVVFDRFLSIPWPASILGSMVPALRAIPSV
jgi:hypothetical protein